MERLPNAVEETEEMDSIPLLNEDILSDEKDNKTVRNIVGKAIKNGDGSDNEVIRALLEKSPPDDVLGVPLKQTFGKSLEKIKQNVYDACSKIFVVKPSVVVARDISITVPSGGYFNSCSFMWTCYPETNPNQIDPVALEGRGYIFVAVFFSGGKSRGEELSEISEALSIEDRRKRDKIKRSLDSNDNLMSEKLLSAMLRVENLKFTAEDHYMGEYIGASFKNSFPGCTILSSTSVAIHFELAKDGGSRYAILRYDSVGLLGREMTVAVFRV